MKENYSRPLTNIWVYKWCWYFKFPLSPHLLGFLYVFSWHVDKGLSSCPLICSVCFVVCWFCCTIGIIKTWDCKTHLVSSPYCALSRITSCSLRYAKVCWLVILLYELAMCSVSCSSSWQGSSGCLVPGKWASLMLGMISVEIKTPKSGLPRVSFRFPFLTSFLFSLSFPSIPLPSFLCLS